MVREHYCKLIECREPDPAAYLGHGWTAYAALTQGVQVKKGDTVFVSSGAGAIGSMAGQIARLLGATRVVGSTSSSSKARWMQEELGYDAVVTRDGGPMIAQLAKAAPEGIDVIVVDMVGGEQLAAAIKLVRVLMCLLPLSKERTLRTMSALIRLSRAENKFCRKA